MEGREEQQKFVVFLSNQLNALIMSSKDWSFKHKVRLLLETKIVSQKLVLYRRIYVTKTLIIFGHF